MDWVLELALILNKAFRYYLPIFCHLPIFDDFSKFRKRSITLKTHQKWVILAKIWQKMKKSLVQVAFDLFLVFISGLKNPISETRSITSAIPIFETSLLHTNFVNSPKIKIRHHIMWLGVI